MKPHLTLFTPCLLAAAVSTAVPAFAEGNTLEEIVVTAQKRVQSLQDVPVAVSVFSGDDIERAGLDDMNDLAVMTPGVSGATSDSYNDNLAFRGIRTNDYGIGGDPSVAVFKDGVWAGRNGGAVTSFFDMQRAEVVKGPQATLFGRNAIAGAISTFTNKPIEDFEGKLSVGIADYQHSEATATINLPISDRWYARVSAHHSEEAGYIENRTGGSDLGGSNVDAARVSLRFAGDSLDATLVMEYEDREGSPVPYRNFEYNGTPKDVVFSDLYARGEGGDESEIFSATLNAEYVFDNEYTLTSISGYKTFNFHYQEDYDGNQRSSSEYIQDNQVDYWSQEFRLNSPTDRDVFWFVGVSAYEENIDNRSDYPYHEDDNCGELAFNLYGEPTSTTCSALYAYELANLSDPLNDGFIAPFGSSPGPGIYKAETAFNKLQASGYAVYGDLTWQVSERLEIIIGARYAYDEKTMRVNILEAAGELGNFYALPNPTNGWVEDSDNWDKWTMRAAANYEVSDSVSVYASYAEGYKSGGFQTFNPGAFEPEVVDSYELGVKTRLLNNTLALNAALYYYEYSDLQLLWFDGPLQRVNNIGEAVGQGVEIDGRWLPNENLEIAFSLGYGDSEYSDAAEMISLGICSTDCEGNQLQNAPRWSSSLSATYTQPMEHGDAFAIVEYTYEDERSQDPDEVVWTQSWESTNLRLGYASANGWEATFWVENLFNETHFESGINGDGAWTTGAWLWPSKPRTAGVKLDYSF